MDRVFGKHPVTDLVKNIEQTINTEAENKRKGDV